MPARLVAAQALAPELPCGHVGVELGDQDAGEAKHGNAAIPVLSPVSRTRGSSRVSACIQFTGRKGTDRLQVYCGDLLLSTSAEAG